MELLNLLSRLPDGKKRVYLGQIFVEAVYKYHVNYVQTELDIDQLTLNNIESIIARKDFINDIILFAKSELGSIFNELNIPMNLDSSSVRKALLKYYNLELTIEGSVQSEKAQLSKSLIPLHPFQERIRRKVVNLIFNDKRRFLVHMPTGSGKTRTAAEIVLDFFRLSSSKALLNEKVKILWIAQSNELCQQAAETVEWILSSKSTKDITLGHFYDSNDLDGDILNDSAIIFCSIQKLLGHYQNEFWSTVKANTFLVVVDEAHRSVASKWVNALNFFVGDSSVYLLGLTATPGLSDGSSELNYLLSTYFHGNRVPIMDENYVELNSPIDYLTDLGFLAQLDRVDIDSNVSLNGDDFEFVDGEFRFANRTLSELSMEPARNLSIINIIRENVQLGKKILVFTCSVEHNRILRSILLDFEIEAAAVDAGGRNREKIINDFKNGNLNVLLNFGVLTTGFDAPRTDICIIARPINSLVMYSQMVGRILRGPRNNGNEKNKLFTIKDNLNHGDYDELFKCFNQFYKAVV